MNKIKFVKINKKIFSSYNFESEDIPTLYYHEFPLVRWVFWLRLQYIFLIIKSQNQTLEKCLDLGGGGGAFLPSLSLIFKSVTCLDLITKEAEYITKVYKLKNVEIIKKDINQSNFNIKFDTIIAADVLEHFSDLRQPIRTIKNSIKNNGLLFTSLPTENFLYKFLRIVFRITKPTDHYHTAEEVELKLINNGFKKTVSIYAPFYLRILPLFRITAWKIVNAEN